jgi:hypothetical protein
MKFKKLAAAVTIAGAMVVGMAAPAYANPPYYLYSTLRPASANCPYTGVHLYTLHGVGTWSAPYHPYTTVVYANYFAGALHIKKWHDDRFRMANVYNSCVHNDFSYSFFGTQKAYRNVTWTQLCNLGGQCNAGTVTYGKWVIGAWG